MFKYKNLAIIALYLLATPALSEDYQSNSLFKHDYKCVADEKGGFNHSATGHELGKFIVDEEFFLVHISNIPEKVIPDMLKVATAHKINQKKGLSSQEVEVLRRNELEKDFLNKQVISTLTIEEGSYFFREPSEDPNDAITYLRGDHCDAVKNNNYASINCHIGDYAKTFQFNLATGRFTYSYAGTWNDEVEDGYYGDSSSFAFGTCEIYYR
ncbi:hypothetical protein [Methylophaga sp.]|jgi:hypothetical protein|uniref:hypothetical protein n=1 Tax=Methylophaga sp. TaxID=2024840 RepID=UPI002716A836|nr:hypothetical protein [Methylophaga sp.]MDO8827721.1 hypothetical protein [Methylophaga sp.]